MLQSWPWRAAKNRHCADMTQQTQTETETRAKAGAVIIPVTLFEQNCTLIWCEATKKAAVIDPGGDVAKIRATIKQSNVTVEKIWLTHGHIAHVRQVPARQCGDERRAFRHIRRTRFRAGPLAR